MSIRVFHVSSKNNLPSPPPRIWFYRSKILLVSDFKLTVFTRAISDCTVRHINKVNLRLRWDLDK
jgi:hypothetical protein